MKPTSNIKQTEKSKIIASSHNVFNIELIKNIDKNDANDIINISKDLEKIYGPNSLLTETNISRYFNDKTLPFISRYKNQIIGFIIGVPLEYFKNQAWGQYDDNMSKNNTLYTYAFIFKKEFRGRSGFAKTLKKIYTSWAKKRGFSYISGHMSENVIQKSNKKNVEIIKKFDTWYDAKDPFVYYRKKI